MIERKVHKLARPIYRAVTAAFPGWRDTWSMIGAKPEGWRPQEAQVGAEYFKLIAPYTTYQYE